MAHCHADEAGEDDVRLYLAAAEDAACAYLNRKVFANKNDLKTAIEEGEATEKDMVVNPSIVAAILLITGHLYANREQNVTGMIVAELKTGAYDLLRPYRLNNGV